MTCQCIGESKLKCYTTSGEGADGNSTQVNWAEESGCAAGSLAVCINGLRNAENSLIQLCTKSHVAVVQSSRYQKTNLSYTIFQRRQENRCKVKEQ